MGERIRVFIIGSRILSEVLASLLEVEERIEVAGQGLHLADIPPSSADVILVESNTNGPLIDLLRELRHGLSGTPVIIVGLKANEDELTFIEAGASAFVLSEHSLDELVHVIESVHEGLTICSPRVTGLVLSRIGELCRMRKVFQSLRLTRQEEKILQLIAQGCSNKEIAQQLRITTCTAKNHVHNLLRKFQVHRRKEAIRLAYESGLLKGFSIAGLPY